MVTQIVSYFFSIIALIAGLVTLFYCYKKEYQAPYRIRNTFPYELIEGKTTTNVMIGKILMVLSFVALGVYFIVFPGDRSNLGVIKVIAGFINVIGILTVLSFFGIALVNMKNVKLHMIADAFFFAFSFILTTAIAIMGFWTLKDTTASGADVKKLILAGVASLVGIVQMIMFFNPKLRNWAQLEEKSDENGSMVYSRPKWFVLAYSEWTFVFTTYLNGLILFLMFI